MNLQKLEGIENQDQQPMFDEENGNVPHQFDDDINQAGKTQVTLI